MPGSSRPPPGQAVAQLVWVNGRADREASALERGLHFGDGLFETVAWVGRARFLELHLQRLAAGCARLGLAAPDEAILRAEVQELAAPSARAIIKVLLPTRISLRYAWPPEDPELAREGVRVRIAALRLGENPALAGLKHCNRLEQVLARREWTDSAIAEALMFSSSGALICGTASNVFLVRDGRLYTPRVDRCGVAGIMRQVVLTAAAGAGIAAEERVLDLSDLQAADEVFLTNALIGIRPVRELDGRPLSPAGVTRRLQERLAPLLEARAPLPEGASGA